MVIIEFDPHKRTHTASALDPGHAPSAGRAADRRHAGRLQAAAAMGAAVRVAALGGGNARGLGRHLAQWLTARGEHVDVPSTATAAFASSRAVAARTTSSTRAVAASVAALARRRPTGRR